MESWICSERAQHRHRHEPAEHMGWPQKGSGDLGILLLPFLLCQNPSEEPGSGLSDWESRGRPQPPELTEAGCSGHAQTPSLSLPEPWLRLEAAGKGPWRWDGAGIGEPGASLLPCLPVADKEPSQELLPMDKPFSLIPGITSPSQRSFPHPGDHSTYPRDHSPMPRTRVLQDKQ